MAATAYDLIWGDGVVPAWLVSLTVLFLILMPLLRLLFPETCKKEGVFLGAFELTCAGPVRVHPDEPSWHRRRRHPVLEERG